MRFRPIADVRYRAHYHSEHREAEEVHEASARREAGVTDHATPNLPSRDFDATAAFFAKLGFVSDFKDGGWMILRRGGLTLEFFPHPDLNPGESWFSCCLRVDDLPALYQALKDAGLPETCRGWPRLHAPQQEDSGLTIAYAVDPDGTLLRLIQN